MAPRVGGLGDVWFGVSRGLRSAEEEPRSQDGACGESLRARPGCARVSSPKVLAGLTEDVGRSRPRGTQAAATVTLSSIDDRLCCRQAWLRR